MKPQNMEAIFDIPELRDTDPEDLWVGSSISCSCRCLSLNSRHQKCPKQPGYPFWSVTKKLKLQLLMNSLTYFIYTSDLQQQYPMDYAEDLEHLLYRAGGFRSIGPLDPSCTLATIARAALLSGRKGEGTPEAVLFTGPL